MTSLDDPGVKALLDKPNHAVLSTLAQDSYPMRQEGEQCISFLIAPRRVRHQKPPQ